VAPHRGSCREEHTERDAGGDERSASDGGHDAEAQQDGVLLGE
jgi:hypothetical protein